MLTIEINSETVNEATISILDITGKTVQTEILNNIQGETKHQIEVANLSKGTYFVTFNVNGVLTFEKMVKM
jgi:hypothetical protein